MPTTDKLPIGESFRDGFTRFKEKPWLLVAVAIIACVLPTFISEVGERVSDSGLLSLAAWVVTITLELGLINIVVRMLNDERVELANMFDIFPRVPFAVVSTFVAMIAIAFGFMLLIVPGIILSVRLQFLGYAIIEGHGPIESIQRSWEMTRGFTFDLFVFGLAVGGLLLLGVICLGVGMFIAIPVITLAQAYVYRFLKARYQPPSAQPVAS